MDPLQKFGHRDSAYERPNEAWVCGWAAEGDPCPRGPDARGCCPMRSECTPTKHGDRYSCALSVAAGGPCEQGPLPDGSCCKPKLRHPPCQPRRSLRGKRARAGWAAVAVTVAVLAIALGGERRLDFVSPGELSSAHATIPHPEFDNMPLGQSCAACHAAADPHGPGVIEAVMAGGVALRQSEQCLQCHFTEQGRAAHALDPHGLPPQRLDEMTRHAEDELETGGPASLALRLARLAPSPLNDRGQLACAQCHFEHRGKSFDLTHMTDARCQSCHSKPFHSFSDGHPEFRPAREEPAIIFDHDSHRDHFAHEPFACLRCHTPRTRSALLPFEQSCASCHANQSDDHHREQIRRMELTVFEVPELEVPEDSEAGDWPFEIATGMEMPLVMRLLVVSDDRAVEPLREVREEFWEPGMWFDPDPDQATYLALAIKDAMRDLLTGDEVALRHRLAIALAMDPDDTQIVRVVREMVRSPLSSGLQQHPAIQRFLAYGDEAGIAPPDDVPDRPAEARDEVEAAVGWILRDSGAVEYRKPDHADPFYKALLDLLAIASASDAPSDPQAAHAAAAFRADVREEVWQTVLDGGPLAPFTLGCLKCHNTHGNEIVWSSPDVAFQHPRSAFDHDDDPHLVLHQHPSLGEPQQCMVCHTEIDRDNSAATDLADWIDFQPLNRASCADCHNPFGARESCLTCHTYHHQ